jgi:hypothetical protein
MLGSDRRPPRVPTHTTQGKVSHDINAKTSLRVISRNGKANLRIQSTETDFELMALEQQLRDGLNQQLQMYQVLSPEYKYPPLPSDPMIPSSSINASPNSSPFSKSFTSSWSPRAQASPLGKSPYEDLDDIESVFSETRRHNFLTGLHDSATPSPFTSPPKPIKLEAVMSPKVPPEVSPVLADSLPTTPAKVESRLQGVKRPRSSLQTPISSPKFTPKATFTPKAKCTPKQSTHKVEATLKSGGRKSTSKRKQPLSAPYLNRSPGSLKRNDEFVGHAMIFGRNASTPKPLNEYQRKINDASLHLASKSPRLIDLRKDLFELAKQKLLEDGYQYSRGSSRSKYDPKVAQQRDVWEAKRGQFSDIPSSPGLLSDEEKPDARLSADQRRHRILQLEELLKTRNIDISDYESTLKDATSRTRAKQPQETHEEIKVLLDDMKSEREAIKVELGRLKSKERKFQTHQRQRNKRLDSDSDDWSARPPLI